MDVRFQHNPIESVFTVLSYRGVKNTAVRNMTRVFQMVIFPPFIIDSLPDIPLPVTTTYDSVYYPVHNLFNVEFQCHDVSVRGEILGSVSHRNPRYPDASVGIFIVSEAVQPQKHFLRKNICVVIIG